MDSASFLKSFDVGAEEITGLIPHIGPLLKLLTEEHKSTNNAGDKLAQAYTHKATSCEMLTSYALRGLLDAITQHFNPGSRQIRGQNVGLKLPPAAMMAAIAPTPGAEVLPAKVMAKVFLSHENKVWFRVVLAIMLGFPKEDDTEERFSLLNNRQKVGLLKAFLRHNRTAHGNKQKLIRALKEVLGDNHMCKLALHDVLHFLSVSTEDLPATCDVLGLALFLPNDTNILCTNLMELKNRSQKLRETCSSLLQFLVAEQNPIFNFRKRKFEEDFNNALESLTFKELEEVRLNRLKQHLRHFFELRDPPFVRIVGALFRYYEFNDIATGLFAKYRILPFGWKQELEKATGQVGGVDPFNTFIGQGSSTKNRRAKKKDYNKLSGSYFEVEETEVEGLNSKALSTRLDPGHGSFSWLSKYLQKRKVKFLTEKTLSWPETSPVKVYAPTTRNTNGIDRIVDEFLEKQRDLLNTLRAFHNYFVVEATAIANGDLGPEAQQAFGLSLQEVRMLFKANFKEVISAQEMLVVALEPLMLVKEGVIRKEFKGYGRAGILFLLFVRCQKVITKGFQHYNVSYKRKTDLLSAKRNEVLGGNRLTANSANGLQSNYDRGFASSKKVLRKGGPKRAAAKHLNFLELWEEMSTTKSQLSNKQLDTILIAPVQAVPRYKIFFDRLLKKLGPDYPGKADGERAVQVAETISTAVNENIKKNKDLLDKILGPEERG